MKILGIIPARYASTRFPGKPLVHIDGKSMIRRVYEQASQSTSLSKIVVATDHFAVFENVKEFGGEVVMTSDTHLSGTDRCWEAFGKAGSGFDYIVNIQGDEPFIKPEQIDLLCSVLQNKEIEIATLIKKIEDEETLFNPNTPKVIFNKYSEAIYFSRQTIPFVRGSVKESWLGNGSFYKHIGIYAYRSDILKKITLLSPSDLEIRESLEQLRWLENGFKIKVVVTEFDSAGIDTPEDLEKIKRGK
jgi:3-deoxy-manno-octulosonate cytidylyltransferase (CMP-KDO synthetase)